jgi:hypothetical protein
MGWGEPQVVQRPGARLLIANIYDDIINPNRLWDQLQLGKSICHFLLIFNPTRLDG